MNRYKLFKAGVDVNQGVKRVNNDKEFYESLLSQFFEEDYYKQLINAMEHEQTDLAFQHAHALKGMSGNLSLTRLYDALTPFVGKLREGKFKEAQELFGEVQSAYEVLENAVKDE